MAVDRTQNTYRGLLLQDPRLVHSAISSTDSSYSEAEPKPGVPADQNTVKSAMVLQASGSQAAQTTLNVLSQRGGFPGVNERSGGFVYKLSTDGATEYKGWNVPNVISGWEWFKSFATTGIHSQLDVIATKAGYALCVGRNSGTVVSPAIKVFRFDPDSPGWTYQDRISSGDWDSTLPANLYPCLCELPSGRILCFFWVRDTATDEAQVQMYYSDDDGANFQLGSRYCLDATVDTATYNLRRIRAVYNQGQILMVAEIQDPTKTGTTEEPEALIQWASDDDGITFTTVYTFDLVSATTENGAQPEILPLSNGGFQVFMQDTNAASGVKTQYRKIDNAFHSLGDVADTNISTGSESSDDMAVWRGEEGLFYLCARIDVVEGGDTGGNMMMYRSKDEGDTWEVMNTSGANTFQALWIPREAGNYFDGFSACELRGQSIMVSNLVTDSGTVDSNGTIALYIGGHTDLTYPSLSTIRSDANQSPFAATWVAIEEPDQLGEQWEKSTSGTPTVTLSASGLRIQEGNLDAVDYQVDTVTGYLPDAVDKELVVYYQGRLVEGGAPAVDKAVLLVRQADGTNDYEVQINFFDSAQASGANAGYLVNDNNSGTNSGEIALDITQEFELVVSMLEGVVRVWHRIVGDFGEPERTGWTLGYSDTGLTNDTSTPQSKGTVQFGGIATGGVTTDYYVRTVSYLILDTDYVGLSGGFTNPDDLWPRGFSRDPVTLGQGTAIAAVDGPTVSRESWNIVARSLYGIENIDPNISPSPRQKWRTTDTSEQTIVWQMNPADNGILYGPGFVPTVAIYIGGANWRTATLKGVTAVGAETTICSIDLGLQYTGTTGIKYFRQGQVVTPGPTSDPVTRWIENHELVGGTIDFGSSKLRRITRNFGGAWTVDETTSIRPRLYCEDIDDSEGTTGTGVIWVSDGVFFIRELPSAGGYERIKLVIDSQSTAEGYFETGVILVGSVATFGKDYSWGRRITTEANTEVTTRRGGTRYARNLGPARRIVEFGWSEGIDSTSIHDLDADYAKMGSSGPDTVASPADTPNLLEGILLEQNGPERLLVYLPDIDGTTDSAVSMTARGQVVYGRMGSRVRRDVILGEENDTEVMRVATIEISEEV